MGLRRRITDWSYRMYDRMRHKSAWNVPVGDATTFDGMRDVKYAVLVTFKRDGTPVPTPVWFGLGEDDRFYTLTGAQLAKVRRIRNDPRVHVFPSDARGKPKGPAVAGSARILGADEAPRAEAALDAHYGRTRRLYESKLGEPDGVYIEVVPSGR